MRKIAAFLYASLIYGMIGTGIWWVFDKAATIAEEFQSTTVTLVSPDESFEDAQQQVNSEASEASRAQEAPPEKEEPEKVEPEPEPTPPPEPEPQPEEKTPPPPEPQIEEPPPPEPQKMEEVQPEAVEEPLPDPVEETQPTEELPRFKPLDPVDPKKALDLKCCPSEPVKKHIKKRRVHRKKSRKAQRHAASRASARSRARRGGSRNVNRLLAQIKRRIARNKSYPSVAKRRRMQGVVRVSFTITRSGGVRGISVSGPRIFAASARSAVRRAFPVNVGSAGISLPRRMSVTLRYRLH